MTRPSLRLTTPLVLAMALVLAGAGIALVGFSVKPTTPDTVALLRGDRSNEPINAGAFRRTDLTANNSPSLAVNPADAANLVVSNRIDLPAFSCGLHHSADGGATWAQTDIPTPAREEPKCYAPDVAFGADGTLYVSFVTLKGVGNEPNAVWLTSSQDGGRTLTTPIAVTGPHAFQVRLVADQHRAGRLYLSWLQVGGVGNLGFSDPGNPVMVVRTDDGGATFAPPVAVTPPSRMRPLAPSLAVGPSGQVYALYLDLREDSLDYDGAHGGRGGEPYQGRWGLILARSTDEGATWSESVVEDSLVPSERVVAFLPPFPSLAVDAGSGRLYAAFQSARDGDADVYLWSSDSAGQSFSPAVRVNDTAPHDGTSQYLPRLGVAPDGRLDVIYYDRRRDPKNVMNEVSLQSSFDQGRSFGRSITITDRSFDSRIGFGSERDLPDLGSRLALLSTNTRALAVWADTRAGTTASGKQDLARAVVAFSPSHGGRSWWAYGGLAVLALGVIIAAGSVLAGRRARG